MTVAGSCTEYAFHFCGESEWLFAFESPIDMLAFITLVLLISLLPSLAFLYKHKENIGINIS